MRRIKRIGITFGDIAGVGPEVIYKALSGGKLDSGSEYILFGDKEIFSKVSILLKKYKLKSEIIFASDLSSDYSDDKKVKFNLKDKGRISGEYGAYSIKWIRDAVEAYKKGQIDGLVTAPINKEACHKAGFKFKGHTDFLAHLFNNPVHKMMFYSEGLKLILVSHHKSLKSAISSLTGKDIFETIVMGNNAACKMGIKQSEILVAGLNPHAGENGAFGDEEIEIIKPAITKAKLKGINVKGPFPPDTIFLNALKNKNSVVVSMYHDQGLIAFKMIAFDEGVNITAGLPMIRTSPDHGTAFDIAWKGIAKENSMINAINLCAKLI